MSDGGDLDSFEPSAKTPLPPFKSACSFHSQFADKGGGLRSSLLWFLITKMSIGWVVLWLVFCPIVQAGDWCQWRGPFQNGSAEAKDLPERWSAEQNIRWSTDMPGEGASTPIIQGDRVYITSTDRESKDLHLICLCSRTGRILWRKSIHSSGRKMPYNKDAAPSAIADGERVFFLFGSGEFMALDREGQEIWHRNLEQDFGPLTVLYLYGASPLLYRDKLYLAVLRDDTPARSPYYRDLEISTPLDSFLLCIDPKTGKDLWKQNRPSDAFGLECRDSYATPVPYEWEDRAEILVIGASYLTGHDPETGLEKWRFNYQPEDQYRQRVVPTPIVVDDLIIASKPRKGSLFALRPNREGEIPYRELVWEYSRHTPDVPSVLYYRERLYFLQDSRKVMTCLNPMTGECIWEGKIGGKDIYHASPTGADGKIYCVNLAGEVVGVAASDEFQILSRMEMGGEPCMSTIAVADESLYLRTEEKLYCIGKRRGE